MKIDEAQEKSESRIEKLRKLSEKEDERSEDLILLDPESYSEVATEKRIEIIEALRKRNYGSKKELAEDLERDIKNIHEDLEILRRNSVVEMERNGKKVSPSLKHKHVAGERI